MYPVLTVFHNGQTINAVKPTEVMICSDQGSVMYSIQYPVSIWSTMEYTVGLDLPVSIAVLYISIYHISHDEGHL